MVLGRAPDALALTSESAELAVAPEHGTHQPQELGRPEGGAG